MRSPKYPEETAGRVLIPHVIDDMGRDEPDRILYEFPKGTNVARGFQSVSAAVYANAINRAAWFLEKSLGRGANFETLGYVGPGDLRYLILTMLFTSPRNSLEGEIAVIKGAECKTWLVPSKGSNIQRVLDVYSLKTLELPDLDYFLDAVTVPLYKYNKIWEVGRSEPCWVLHTSGSTGHPKPVVRNLASVSCFGANLLCQPVDGRPLVVDDFIEDRVYITFPLFHAAGLNNSLLWPLFYGCTMILGPELPVTIDVMKDVIKYGKPNAIFAAPSLVEDISLDEEFLKILECIKVIAYAGGPLSQKAGDIISKRTKVVLSMGTTESGWHISVELDREDWNNIRFHPNSGFDLQEISEGLYELVAVRRPQLERWQMIFETFPDEQEYHFKDLFSKHPTKKDLWHYEGRIDNIIVLSNGEKLNPTAMETIISGHPSVDSLILAGQGRFQTFLLVEPVKSTGNGSKSSKEFIDDLWPTIQQANREAPSHAKLFKSHILIASPDKPFLRASKGTVRKVPTLQLYEEEIDRLYALADSDGDLEDVKPFNLANEGGLRDDIRKAVRAVTDFEDLADEDDIFAAGADSLQVLTLQRWLRKGLSLDDSRREQVKPSLIYGQPTVKLLSRAVWNSGLAGQDGDNSSSEAIRVQVMQDLVDRHTSDLPAISRSSINEDQTRTNKAVVILTGSTGSLGSYLLDTLISSPAVTEIWCLNRSADAEQRQNTSNRRRGLSTDWKSSNVHFRHADLSKENLGLSGKDHEYLLKSATNIIHTQWKVDFNLSLLSFSPHIRGIRHIVDFALSASTLGRNVAIFFTSSVGVAYNWKSSATIPEQAITELSVARTGYGESKLVAESVLLEAARRSGMDVTVGRVGQIAGPVKKKNASRGMWNRKEWLPSIIDASKQLFLVPQALGKNNSIDWIPVDILAEIIVQLALEPKNLSQRQVFHIVNPVKASWESLLPAVLAHLDTAGNDNHKITAVPWSDWVAALTAHGVTEPQGSESLSAVKLIDFFNSLNPEEVDGKPKLRAVFETTETSASSDVFRDLLPVNKDWMEIWLEQWGY